MMKLKSYLFSIALLAGVSLTAHAEGPNPLPFDSAGYSDTPSKQVNAAPSTPTPAAAKEDPKKSVRAKDDEDDDDGDATKQIKKCEKVAPKKVKGKKAGPAKTVCKTVTVKEKPSKSSKSHAVEGKRGKKEAEDEPKASCKKGKKCKSSNEEKPSSTKKKATKKPVKKK
ncbi:hypothetical protein LIN78_16785 [Leeia sp. TBRC 13508]|uniref:Uncharacterized protein n=1 Tax=Leeia speluncae TaxID=2884804 RepID=A0ABS8DAG5_9NEIS|nr:hypothetical protein [Leeia speluncae]MCB6185204.1 hypothetical protein [Leeia speluncae]